MARALALAERAQQHAQQAPSPEPPKVSTVGDLTATAIAKSKIPRLYLSSDWDKVRDPGVKQWTLGLEGRMHRRDSGTFPNWRMAGHGLLVLGPVGTGKSSAAALCGIEALLAERTVRWTYVPELLDMLGSGPRDRRVHVADQTRVDLLIWDDLMVRDMADWEVGYLDQIVESRYRSRKPMIVTSNVTPDDLRSDGRMARMVDRWRERVCSSAVILGGESMRGDGLQAGVK